MSSNGSINPDSLESELDEETRIFCVFYNNKTRKYRVTQSDIFIVDNILNSGSFLQTYHSKKEIRR